MQRKALIAGNWKMNKNVTDAAALAKELVELAAEYTSSTRIQARLIAIVTNGGWDRLSDQLVTIPLVK